MKQSPATQAIQDNLKPGALSSGGFLGEDGRALADILREDQATMDRLGLTHAALAARLRELAGIGLAALGRPVSAGDDLEVEVEEFMGSIPCPFRDRVRTAKRTIRVVRPSTGRELRWTDLNLHMIECHGFYEGKGSAFRVDPAEAADLLGLVPEPTSPD